MPLTVERKLIIDRSLSSSSVLTHPYKSFYLLLRVRASSPHVMQQADKETNSKSRQISLIFVELRLFPQLRHLCDLSASSLMLLIASSSCVFHTYAL